MSNFIKKMSISRDITLQIESQLSADEVILLVGSRQSGKTTILHQIEAKLKTDQKPSYFLNLEDPEYLALLNESPKNLFKIFSFDLKEKTFIFIDEVQYLKNPSNFLKYFFDEYRGKIKIIASGSSAFFLDRKFKDSLVGRKKIFTLRTLSFREFLRFKGEDDLLKKGLQNLALNEKEKVSFYYREFIIYGGYPKVVLSPLAEKENILKDLAFSYIKKDIFEANIKQEELMFKLLRVLASQVGGLVNFSELASTLGSSRTTIEEYLAILQRSFHIALVSPLHKNLRKEITKMQKVYFLDLGLRNFLTKNFQPYNEREDKGQVLENAVFRELLNKNEMEEVRFWRTINKQEVDFVVNEKAFEVKATPKTIKTNSLKIFSEAYPNKKISFVSFDISKKDIGSVPVLEPWEI
ncbi:ATP-binding protein [Candidatus Parcubacteria bacterium]|nr:ATP-binding protein [Candidatus Parcubacteria bacterium]